MQRKLIAPIYFTTWVERQLDVHSYLHLQQTKIVMSFSFVTMCSKRGSYAPRYTVDKPAPM